MRPTHHIQKTYFNTGDYSKCPYTCTMQIYFPIACGDIDTPRHAIVCTSATSRSQSSKQNSQHVNVDPLTLFLRNQKEGRIIVVLPLMKSKIPGLTRLRRPSAIDTAFFSLTSEKPCPRNALVISSFTRMRFGWRWSDCG